MAIFQMRQRCDERFEGLDRAADVVRVIKATQITVEDEMTTLGLGGVMRL